MLITKERKQLMRNMAILVDTNVIINYLTNREDAYLNQSIEIVKRCSRSQYIGYIAFHTLSIIWYVLRRYDDKIRRNSLKNICEIFTVVAASQSEILDAIENDSFVDFEDCLQDKCAKEIGADFIVTCNIKDYENSEVIAINPDDFLKMFE